MAKEQGASDKKGMVCVCILSEVGDIALAESLLRAADIPYFVHGRQASQLFGRFVPVMSARIMVPPDRADEARELLADIAGREPEREQ